jgi:hypothetical protein|tara:strand:+ start:520 stop:690 length:171 start_codon:yes stop_codon:yes gene_type:complete
LHGGVLCRGARARLRRIHIHRVDNYDPQRVGIGIRLVAADPERLVAPWCSQGASRW